MTILYMLMLWYGTKVYYTHTFKINLAESDLFETRCASCSKPIYKSVENIRSLNYCTQCL